MSEFVYMRKNSWTPECNGGPLHQRNADNAYDQKCLCYLFVSWHQHIETGSLPSIQEQKRPSCRRHTRRCTIKWDICELTFLRGSEAALLCAHHRDKSKPSYGLSWIATLMLFNDAHRELSARYMEDTLGAPENHQAKKRKYTFGHDQ